jgi:pimeloyl-ACP methyl ester carboxylesterase
VAKLPGVGELTLALFGRAAMVGSVAKDMIAADAISHFKAGFQIQLQYIGYKRAILSTIRNRMLGSFYEIYERVGKLRKPTLLLWGRQDRTVRYSDSQALRKAIPHAEFHAIENSRHLPHYEKPEIVNPILLEFLRRG